MYYYFSELLVFTWFFCHNQTFLPVFFDVVDHCNRIFTKRRMVLIAIYLNNVENSDGKCSLLILMKVANEESKFGRASLIQ